MRRFLLATALVLVSATAQAGPSRSLSLASSDTQVAAKPADADGTTDNKATVAATTQTTTATTALPQGSETARPSRLRANRAKHRDWTEARIISELHRHGIYW
jgi:hypothetical protein